MFVSKKIIRCILTGMENLIRSINFYFRRFFLKKFTIIHDLRTQCFGGEAVIVMVAVYD